MSAGAITSFELLQGRELSRSILRAALPKWKMAKEQIIEVARDMVAAAQADPIGWKADAIEMNPDWSTDNCDKLYRIGKGVMDPRLYYPRGTQYRLLYCHPIEVQARLLDGEAVEVWNPSDPTQPRMIALKDLSPEQAKMVISSGPYEIRNLTQQRTWWEKEQRKLSTPEPGVNVDPGRGARLKEGYYTRQQLRDILNKIEKRKA